MRPAIFLDKDGTLVEDVPYNVDPQRVALCDGAIDAMRLLKDSGYALVVVSNQPGLAMGRFDDAAFSWLRVHLTELFEEKGVALDGFYHCPHHPDGSVTRYATRCDCRKPMPGMLLRAAAELGLDLRRSWMLGDILNDVEAGHRAGCKSALIDNGNETEWTQSPLRVPDLSCTNLLEAARSIVAYADRICEQT